MSALLLTSVKDEGPWLVEWIAFHKAIGVGDILIYQNDSTDLTTEILFRLQELGVVHYKDNSGQPIVDGKPARKRPQLEAYSDAFGSDLYCRNKWCLVLDVDEYLNLKRHSSIKEFCDYHSAADAVAINWRCFGSSGQTLWSPEMTIDRFKRCAPEQHDTSLKFKSIHRTDRGFQAIGIHRPKSNRVRDSYVYADGERVPDKLQLNVKEDKWKDVQAYHKTAQINHYTIRSRQEAERKIIRGRGTGQAGRNFGEYFKRFNRNEEEDTSISRHNPVVSRYFEELMNDNIIRDLHHESCVMHFGSQLVTEAKSGSLSAA